jgi:hypothetical protein
VLDPARARRARAGRGRRLENRRSVRVCLPATRESSVRGAASKEKFCTKSRSTAHRTRPGGLGKDLQDFPKSLEPPATFS